MNVSAPAEAPIKRYVEHVMNMPISLALRGRHAQDDAGVRAWERVMAVLHEVDAVFSTYRFDSFISRLAREEIGLADCPEQVREVIRLGEQAEIESHGAFSIWRPDPDGSLTLDPSGVVKGWAVERAAQHLRILAGTDFCLSAGGDMVCRTLDPDAPPWQIGIEDPHDSTRICAVVPLANGAVATSGAAHRGAHIVDARTGTIPGAIASVTVIGDNLTWADIDATAAYALGSQAVDWLSTRQGRSALVIWADGTHDVVPTCTVAPDD
ncbi:MAG: FAD:protein FMN transferase [Marmoricola sp.]